MPLSTLPNPINLRYSFTSSSEVTVSWDVPPGGDASGVYNLQYFASTKNYVISGYSFEIHRTPGTLFRLSGAPEITSKTFPISPNVNYNVGVLVWYLDTPYFGGAVPTQGTWVNISFSTFPPNSPSNVRAVAGNQQLTIGWDAPVSGPTVSGYALYDNNDKYLLP